MDLQKVPKFVTPAKAGVQNLLERLDYGFRRNDAKREFLTVYEFVNIECEQLLGILIHMGGKMCLHLPVFYLHLPVSYAFKKLIDNSSGGRIRWE
jgi:hypothetical protein